MVIDKGTLDALLPPAFDLSAKETVEQMFAEVFRVLAIGGRYIIVSLLQEHILRFYLNHFNERFIAKVNG